ncbi:MAG TPA: hypothetical protein VM537_10860 [Anaerolineae bacterium]|nr:hypothetical protein [Anaerolineae bacterium]
MSAPKILLTGRPGVGKTCAIKHTLTRLEGLRAVGSIRRSCGVLVAGWAFKR